MSLKNAENSSLLFKSAQAMSKLFNFTLYLVLWKFPILIHNYDFHPLWWQYLYFDYLKHFKSLGRFAGFNWFPKKSQYRHSSVTKT